MSGERAEYPPISVEHIIECFVDDGSDFHDGIGGYGCGTYDADTEIFSLTFDRHDDIDEDDAERCGFVHGSAHYRFRLIPDQDEPT